MYPSQPTVSTKSSRTFPQISQIEKYSPSASFRSTSQLRPDNFQFHLLSNPGPAYYSVKKPSWKISNQNLDSKWL